VTDEERTPPDSNRSRRELQLTREEMRELGYRVIDMLVEQATTLREDPVIRHGSRPDMEALLREPVPEHGSNPLDVLARVQRDVLAHTAHLTHTRFFGFVPSPGNYVSVLADTLSSAFNPFCGSWLVSAGPSELELVVIDWLRALCGMPEGAGGLFVSGGSVATLVALGAAREARLAGNVSGAVLYCSDQTHTATAKAARILGLAADQVRTVPSDEHFRLPVAVVRAAIARDRAAGLRPFCLVATAGTTNVGSVDPLDELADLCADESIWLHVDGAYGAPAVLTEEGAALLHGMHRADSLAIDPHKWLFQPFEIGCVLVRDAGLLPAAFAVHPEYLRDADRHAEEVNFRDYGIQLTRGFRALKLWMSLQVFGLEAFREAVAWGLHLARVAEEAVRALEDWEVVTPAQLGIVTFRCAPPTKTEAEIDALNESIARAALVDGFALLTTTVVRGRTVLRLCTINPRTTEQDIQLTIDRLRMFGRRCNTSR
jgi:aromatic-L-amino-acid decarboxylase